MAKKSFSKQKNALPLYYKLTQILRDRIITGEYPRGAKIPTEPMLCEEFGMSRVTVRQAVEILENKGFVERQQGRGTFVKETGVLGLGWSFGQSEDVEFLAQNTWLELISKRKIRTSKTVAVDLELSRGEPVYMIKGIRHSNNLTDNRKAIYRAYITEAIGRKILIQPIESQLFFLEVERIYGEPFKSSKRIISAASADEKMAEEMNIQIGSPVLVTKGIYSSEFDGPLLVASTLYAGDSFQSVTVMERR